MTFDAGSIIGSLHFDLSEYTRSMIDAESLAQAFPAVVLEFLENPMLAAIEVFKEAAEKFGEIIGEVGDHAQQIGLDAQKAGTTVQWFDNMTAAAKTLNISQEQVSEGMEMLGRNASDALSGLSPTAAKSFGAIGISMGQLREMMKDPASLFDAVQEGISRMSNAGDKGAAAMNLMSRAGRELLPLLEMHRSEMDEIIETHRRLGAAEDDESVAAGRAWTKITSAFDDMWDGIKKKLADPIVNALAAHLDEVKSIAIGFSDVVGTVVPIALEAMKIAAVPVVLVFDALGLAIEGLLEVAKGLTEITDFIGLTDDWSDKIAKVQDGLKTALVASNDLVFSAGHDENAAPPGSPESLWKAGVPTSLQAQANIEVPSIDAPASGPASEPRASRGASGGGGDANLGGGQYDGDGGIIQASILQVEPAAWAGAADAFRPLLFEIANVIESANANASTSATIGSAGSASASAKSPASATPPVEVQIAALNVAGLNANTIAEAIARQIAPQIKSAFTRQQQAAEASARHSKVEAAVSGMGD